MIKNYFTTILNKYNIVLVLVVAFFFTNFSFGQIAQRGTATTATSIANTITINKPTGVVQGDIMIANLNSVDTGSNLGGNNANLGGWTLISATNLSSNRRRGTILYKIATAAEPAN